MSKEVEHKLATAALETMRPWLSVGGDGTITVEYSLMVALASASSSSSQPMPNDDDDDDDDGEECFINAFGHGRQRLQ